MKWDQIEITGNDNIIHKGEKARKFVEANCPNASIRTYSAGKISVELPEGTSVKPEIVRGHLEDILHGKAKGLKVKIGGKPIVVNFPVGRAVKNVVNVNLAKLKVQFIFKRDQDDLSPKKFLEDERVTVKALREGSTNPLIKVTNKGIADFGVVIPGKYTITFSDLDECKYDWTDETRNVVLQPLSVETIEFQVEPLYQQVQFIAHCLATIPHQTFVKTVEDDEMLEVGDSGGKRTFKFKIKRKDMGKWSFGLLDPAVKNKATYQALKKELTMKSKGVGLEFWSIDDIKDGIKDKLEYTGQKLGDPNTYVGITFKPRFEESEYTAGDLTGKWKGKYHGDVDDIKDITARVKFIEDTLEKSYNKSDKKPTVLKVFMVPECYFQGLYGAYISDDAAKLVEDLQNAVKDKKWKDWIFSFGTVNREFLGLQPKIVTAEANKTIYEMANHAPVIRGGLGDPKSSAGDSTRLIQKLINSAELADEGELIRDPVVTELLS